MQTIFFRHLTVMIRMILLFGKDMLGIKLKTIAPRRNEAAHGGNYITYSEVCTDKKNVYDTSANTYKGLIKELLDIIL